jgi:hypothetical protein
VTTAWTAEELERIGAAGELVIAVQRADGTLRRGLPIWVVCAGDQVFVRSWHRRETGWFGQALKSRRARISVPGLAADVAVQDVGAGSAELCAAVDTAYRTRYGVGGAESMVTPAAAATTLRLTPTREA